MWSHDRLGTTAAHPGCGSVAPVTSTTEQHVDRCPPRTANRHHGDARNAGVKLDVVLPHAVEEVGDDRIGTIQDERAVGFQAIAFVAQFGSIVWIFFQLLNFFRNM